MQTTNIKLLKQNEMSKRTINNIIVSGDINFKRRKKDGKQLIFSNKTTKNPFKSLSKVKYLFEKYEKYKSKTKKTYSGNSISEQTSQL